MKIWLTRIGFVLAVVFVTLTIVNASWLADTPRGKAKLIAHRGITQHFDLADTEQASCTAARIEQPVHDYLENTGRAAQRATEIGATMVEVDIAATRDGELVAFGDKNLDCRTNGTGPVSDASLGEIVKLDAGYGYSADGGGSFPFRGKAVGGIQPLSTWLLYIRESKQVMFNFTSADPGQADMLASVLKELGRDPVKLKYGFYGDPAPIARIKQLYPEAWVWNADAARQCSSDYVTYGWTSMVPESCRNGTMIIPLSRQWMFWGWPNKVIERMDSVGARIIVTGPYHSDHPTTGLSLPEQLGDVPRSFNGYIWVDDIWTVGPALFPDRENRNDAEIEAAFQGLERRRKGQ